MNWQIARTIEFPVEHVSYINWTTLGGERTQLACHLLVEQKADGGVLVTLGWPKDKQ